MVPPKTYYYFSQKLQIVVLEMIDGRKVSVHDNVKYVILGSVQGLE